MSLPAKRMTVRLHHPTLEAIDTLVRGGVGSSRTALSEALVDQAVRAHRRRQREVEADTLYAQAFGDAAYAAEQEEMRRAFAAGAAETARRVDPCTACGGAGAVSKPTWENRWAMKRASDGRCAAAAMTPVSGPRAC
jgi:hypothetical protein